ncbi:MAG TPA: hypothetical protein VLW55_03630 [Burkholderiaceae bacterium]|nr:hypothetical protein [Burkholderiaceae bacterium]
MRIFDPESAATDYRDEPEPGAVVSLMERTNVETVIVAGKIRKWKGRLVEVDLGKLRRDLAASRDDVFAAAGIAKDLYRAP